MNKIFVRYAIYSFLDFSSVCLSVGMFVIFFFSFKNDNYNQYYALLYIKVIVCLYVCVSRIFFEAF